MHFAPIVKMINLFLFAQKARGRDVFKVTRPHREKIVFQFEHLLHQLGHSLKSGDASMDFFFLHSQIWILRYRYDKDSIRRSALTIDIILGRREREIPLLRRGETQAVKRPCNVSRAQLMTSRLRWIPSSNNNIELKNVLGLYNR